MEAFARGLSTDLEPPVKKHLKNVYATFTMSTVCAAAGGYAHLFSSIIGAGMLTGIGAIVALISLTTTPHDGKNQKQRLALLATFSFLTGCNLGNLLNIAIMINPALIMQALLGTAVIFASFSLMSLFAPRGYYLYLGGSLMSALSTLFFLSMMNLFLGSKLLFQANLYIGLVVMCGFIVYDTQMIIEKKRRGDNDFVMHSVELFIDFISIFRKLLVILSNKEVESNKKRRN